MAVRQKELQEIVALHRQRYPLMEPADYGKLLYQSEFGPEHMVDSPERVLEQITREWENRYPGPHRHMRSRRTRRKSATGSAAFT